MNSLLVKVWIGVLLAAIGAYGVFTALRMGGYFAAEENAAEPAPKIVELKPGQDVLASLAGVELVERSGANLRWSELKGQPWVANIFFATCPKECILISHQVRLLQHNTVGVRFVSITCDPERDTPEALQKYAQQYQADPQRWFFATGDMRQIQRASEAIFGFGVKRVEHAPYLAVIDRDGKFVAMYSGVSSQSMKELRAELAKLLSPDRPQDAVRNAPAQETAPKDP